MTKSATPRSEWAKVGDEVTTDGKMVGRVERVIETASVPYAVVQWPTSKGRHTITTLRRVNGAQGTSSVTLPHEGQPVAWYDPTNTEPGQSVTFDRKVRDKWPHCYPVALYARGVAPCAPGLAWMVPAMREMAKGLPNNKASALLKWADAIERTAGVSIPPKPFPAPGKWFPVDVTGTRPMREHAPGKWELAAWPSDGVAIPLATLPESMSRDEMLRYYSEYANMVAHEVLRYQKRIRDLEAALMAAGVPDPCGVEGHTK